MGLINFLNFGLRNLTRFGPRTLRFGNSVLVFRWADVSEMLKRDSDFIIGPVNADRISGVTIGGKFILGMDRQHDLFRQRDAIYNSLRGSDLSMPMKEAARTAQVLIQDAEQAGEIDIAAGYARIVATRTAMSYLGLTRAPEAELADVIRAVFRETFLNLNGDEKVRKRGLVAGKKLTNWINQEIDQTSLSKSSQNLLSQLRHFGREYDYSRDEIVWMMAGVIVGSIDTTTTCVANIMSAAFDDKTLYNSLLTNSNNQELLRKLCWEALRRRPHNPIVLRSAASDIQFANRDIKAGQRVIAVTQSAMQDYRVFKMPADFKTDRDEANYMHFGYGAHACVGRQLNAVQIPLLIGYLINNLPQKPKKIIKDGPFPHHMVCQLKG